MNFCILIRYSFWHDYTSLKTCPGVSNYGSRRAEWIDCWILNSALWLPTILTVVVLRVFLCTLWYKNPVPLNIQDTILVIFRLWFHGNIKIYIYIYMSEVKQTFIMLTSTTKGVCLAHIIFSPMQLITLDLAGPQPQSLSSPQAEISQLQYRPFIWKSWRKLQRTSAVMPSLVRARMPESISVCWKMGRNLQWRSLTPANSLIKNSLCRWCHLYFSHIMFPRPDATVQFSLPFPLQVSAVSRLKHENVVQLVGYCAEGITRVLAYEYATRGSLHDILHGREQVFHLLP